MSTEILTSVYRLGKLLASRRRGDGDRNQAAQGRWSGLRLYDHTVDSDDRVVYGTVIAALEALHVRSSATQATMQVLS